jgi:four helix bundle protein
MKNKEFSKELEKRTKALAIQVIRLSASLPKTIEARVVRNQITKSGSSIGANYREANRSRSKADFYNKIRICESEASETSFWLEIIDELEWSNKEKLRVITKEASELLALFTSISNSSKK